MSHPIVNTRKEWNHLFFNRFPHQPCLLLPLLPLPSSKDALLATHASGLRENLTSADSQGVRVLCEAGTKMEGDIHGIYRSKLPYRLKREGAGFGRERLQTMMQV